MFRSCNNFAHATTAKLSWHEQKCGPDYIITIRMETFSHNFVYELIHSLWNESQYTNSHGHKYWVYPILHSPRWNAVRVLSILFSFLCGKSIVEADSPRWGKLIKYSLPSSRNGLIQSSIPPKTCLKERQNACLHSNSKTHNSFIDALFLRIEVLDVNEVFSKSYCCI